MTDKEVAYAKQLESNPLFKVLLDELQDNAVKIWSTTTDKDQQLLAWAQYRGAVQIRNYVKGYLQNILSNSRGDK